MTSLISQLLVPTITVLFSVAVYRVHAETCALSVEKAGGKDTVDNMKSAVPELEKPAKPVLKVERRSGYQSFIGAGPSWTRRQGKEALMNILDLTDSKRKRDSELVQDDVDELKNAAVAASATSKASESDDVEQQQSIMDGEEERAAPHKKFSQNAKLARFGKRYNNGGSMKSARFGKRALARFG